MTTVPQMRARALPGHYNALRALADGRPVVGPGQPPSAYRGARTLLATLRRWGAIDADGHLTAIGRELLGRKCPDDGACHHGCAPTECFRVGHCGPLSGVYPGDVWPENCWPSSPR